MSMSNSQLTLNACSLKMFKKRRSQLASTIHMKELDFSIKFEFPFVFSDKERVDGLISSGQIVQVVKFSFTVEKNNKV